MRTLKKSLCLVLALVMVLGLFVMGSNAAYTPYGDEAEVTYLDAVQVLTGLGVIEGRTDGNFDPKATVTRAEACAMIARMILGREAADKLPVGDVKFSDVSLESWEGRMAKYIAFCANRGIVVGMGDGTFHPTEPVTGTQLATMLLRALGYGVMGEYEGKGWDINAVADALYYKIFEDSEVKDFSVAATREETALYVFNTLWVDLVAYDVDIDHYVIQLGTFGSEVYDLERIRYAQVMANQATGDPYTVIRYDVENEEWNAETKKYDKKIETLEINLDYESDLGLIAHEVTVYLNIGKEYKDKDNNRYWKTYLLQDNSVTVSFYTGSQAYKYLRDANRTNLEAPWNDLSRVQFWQSYVYLGDYGITAYDLDGNQFKTINELKGWETAGYLGTVVLDSEDHLLATLYNPYKNDQVKKIVGDEIYLRYNDYREDTYDLACAYEGIAKGDYISIQPIGKLYKIYATSTSEINVFERGSAADYEGTKSPTFNDGTLRAGDKWNKMNIPDTVDAWTVQAGDKVLFYLDYTGKFFGTKILERGTLDGVVYVNYAFTKSGEDDYGEPDNTVYIQCVNEKGKEVIYKLDKDLYPELDTVKAENVGNVYKVFLDKKGYATLTKDSSLNNLNKEKGKTSYLTKDGGTYYVTKDTVIYYVDKDRDDLKITTAKVLPATKEYTGVGAYFSSNGTTWNISVLWIKDPDAPKASDSYIYFAAADVENSGTELVDGKKMYYFNNCYIDGKAPAKDAKVFVDVGECDYTFLAEDEKGLSHWYIEGGFYIYNTEVVDGKTIYELEKVEDNAVIKVMDTVTLENGDVSDGKIYAWADGDKLDVNIVILDPYACVSYDKKRFLQFNDVSDIGDFLDDTVGNEIVVSYVATKVTEDKLVPFGTIYIISATEQKP